MYAQVIVPLDGSEFASRALTPAARIAAASDSPLLVVSYAPSRLELPDLQKTVEAQVEKAGCTDATVKVSTSGRPGFAIAEEVEKSPGSLICMSSLGRSRTGAMLGSVAESVLRQVTIPLVLVGPRAEVERFTLDGPIVVCVDGSPTSEAILPIVTSWAIVYGLDVRVVTVLPPATRAGGGSTVLVDSGYVHRVAQQLQREIGRAVDFDVLHGDTVVDRLVDDARQAHASVLAASTHGRTGLRRVAAGSVTAALVRDASQPVLAYRPLQLLT
ncbi:MAG TPA: universal stress protein [Acidimicrobiales bacterium]